MEIKRCEKGHFYDAEANASCPQCAAEMGSFGAVPPTSPMGDQAVPPTAPVNFGASMGSADIGTTVPLGGDTMPVDGPSGFTGGDFSPMNNGMVGGIDDYSPTESIYMGGVPGFSPVVGWLVCVEGPARGADYRLQSGYNYIGRADHMDVCVKGDMKMGRERHALVAYDPEERLFFFGPADGKSIVRLNGKLVMTPQEIKAYDVLTIGSTKLMFVPLCGERFNWNE